MNTVPFRPYRGLNDNIMNIPYSEGYIYFATDTGKIYLDYKNERLTMSGSGASLFYASDTDVINNVFGLYEIEKDSVEGDVNSVKIGDLIINVDGGFYKVAEINTSSNLLYCNKIAVSGSGSGGSGDDSGSGGGTGATISVVSTQDVPYTFAVGRSYEVGFKAIASADTFINITLEVSDAENNKNIISIGRVQSDKEFFIDLGSNIIEGLNKITVYAVGDNSGTASRSFPSRTGIVLKLEKDNGFNPRYVQFGEMAFSCIPVGSISKTLNVYIDNILQATKKLSAAETNAATTLNIPAHSHGVHNLKAVLSADVNGELIETEPIVYQIAWREEGVDAPLVWLPNNYPEEIINYENLTIEYLVWENSEKFENIETHFYKDGVELANSPRLLTYNSANSLYWNIVDYKVGKNNYTIAVGSANVSINVLVKEDTERVMEIEQGGLILNLDSAGRSNEENPSNRTSWVSKTSQGTSVKFNNFNWYNNGWITDENGNSCLRISNGASISIPVGDLGILNSKLLEQALAFEFRFKVRNVKEYSTLITTTVSSEEGETPVIEKVFNIERGVFGRMFGNDRGFCLGTQEAFFKSNATVNARYKEDDIINISFVIDAKTAHPNALLYIYLNGVLSGISRYTPDSDDFNTGISEITFSSNWCDIDLYNVRIYKGTKLSSNVIVRNLTADKKDIIAYDTNAIAKTINDVPTIDYNAMVNYNAEHPDETIIPYMVIKSKAPDDNLPFIKGGKKPVTIRFRNPALDYAYAQGFITGQQYLYGAPSFDFDSDEDAFDVQGTSSQGYPRRNFKWKGKQDDANWVYVNGPLAGKQILDKNIFDGIEYKKWYMDSDIGESTFCFKADYMESSGTHNTGFATYVDNLYTKHPLEDYGYTKTELGNSIRTTVYGFPMLVFQEDARGNITFIGRYNFNLDKACEDTFGFTFGGNSKVSKDGVILTMEEIAECWELLNNQGERCSFRKTDFSALAVETYNEIGLLTEDEWNQGTYYGVTNIDINTGNKTYEISTVWNPAEVYYTKKEGALDVLTDFEPRYSKYVDDFENAVDGKESFASQSQAERNAYILSIMRNLEVVAEWLKSTDETQATNKELLAPVVYGDKTYTIDSAEYRLEKFGREFDIHFDREYCFVYYIMTELLHLYDSRGKNCMLATWGPTVNATIEEIANKEKFYKWYPIFYDIDTQLGISNAGVPTWDYYTEASKENIFSTPNSILWNNLWKVFGDAIKIKYEELRKSNLNIVELDGYYNARPVPAYPDIESWKQIMVDPSLANKLKEGIVSYAKIGRKPIMIYNADQYYKYIAPYTQGFLDTSGQTKHDNAYYYCLQGPRDLMRYLYLRNRINYRDSEWQGGAYSYNAVPQEFKARITANKYSTEEPATSDKWIVNKNNEKLPDGYIEVEESDYPMPLDARADYSGIKPYLRQYVSYWVDEKLGGNPVRYNETEEERESGITLNATSDILTSVKSTVGFAQQINYMGGAEYIKDLGDLSLKYFDQCILNPLKRLTRIIVGNDTEGYFNNQLTQENFTLNAEAYVPDINSSTGKAVNENAKTMLEEIVLTGLRNYGGQVDVSGSEKLKVFRALNTKVTGVTLADGVQIDTLHLPNSLTDLTLVEPVALTGILNQAYNEENKPNKGLFIEGITNTNNDYTKDIHLSTYNIIGGVLGYDSYKLLDTLVKFKEYAINESTSLTTSKELRINLEDVNWSPYENVLYGELYDEDKADLYFIDKGRFKLEPYIYEIDTWEDGTKNNNIYLYDENQLKENITDLSMLDTFINDYNLAMDEFNKNGSLLLNHYKNTSASATRPTLPNITGILYVDNTNQIYEEAFVQEKYQKVFPNLKIFFKEIQPAYTVTYVTRINGTETIERTERYTANGNMNLIYPEGLTPVRLNYDFLGWSEDKDATIALTEEEFTALQFTSDKTYYKFYAVFDIHKFKIHFYNNVDGKKELIETVLVPANSYLTPPSVMPYIDESSLADEERYGLLGYVLNMEDCYPLSKEEGLSKIVDLSSIKSENMDREFYACYIKESVFSSATPAEYFEFGDIVTYGADQDLEYSIKGYYIKPKIPLHGKITIPAEGPDNIPVIGLKDFHKNSLEITHIYFLNPDTIRYIGGYCFGERVSANEKKNIIKWIDFPKKLRWLGEHALRGCIYLQYYNSKNENKFAESSVYYLGESALANTHRENETMEEFIIPGSVSYLGIGSLSWMNKKSGQVPFKNLVFGSKEYPSEFDFNNISTTGIMQQLGGVTYNSITIYTKKTDISSENISTIFEEHFFSKNASDSCENYYVEKVD